jgi:hypothetical protein
MKDGTGVAPVFTCETGRMSRKTVKIRGFSTGQPASRGQAEGVLIAVSAILRAIFQSFDRTEGAHYTGCKTTREAGP